MKSADTRSKFTNMKGLATFVLLMQDSGLGSWLKLHHSSSELTGGNLSKNAFINELDMSWYNLYARFSCIYMYLYDKFA